MLPRLELTAGEIKYIVKILFIWLNNEKESRIVKVISLQALADFAKSNTNLKSKLIKQLRELTEKGAPSLKSRSMKLLKQFLTN